MAGHLLPSNNLLQSESRLLLQDFISDPHNDLSILGAIANGALVIKEITEITGLPSGHVSKYLGVLTGTGFAERRVPVTEPGPSRAGRYRITDPYLRFYFRFLAYRQDQLALGAQDIALAEITRHMIDFIGRYTWEELCREWVLRASAFGEPPMMSDHIGSAWNSKVQIDIAGINSMVNTLVLAECKWTLSKSERKVVADLIEERAARIIPARGSGGVIS